MGSLGAMLGLWVPEYLSISCPFSTEKWVRKEERKGPGALLFCVAPTSMCGMEHGTRLPDSRLSLCPPPGIRQGTSIPFGFQREEEKVVQPSGVPRSSPSGGHSGRSHSETWKQESACTVGARPPSWGRASRHRDANVQVQVPEEQRHRRGAADRQGRQS